MKYFHKYLIIFQTFQEKKGKEPVTYVVVRQKFVILPQFFWTRQNLPESNARALTTYFSLWASHLNLNFSQQ